MEVRSTSGETKRVGMTKPHAAPKGIAAVAIVVAITI